MSLKSPHGSSPPASNSSKESIGKEDDFPGASTNPNYSSPLTSKSGVYLIPRPTSDPNDPLVSSTFSYLFTSREDFAYPSVRRKDLVKIPHKRMTSLVQSQEKKRNKKITISYERKLTRLTNTPELEYNAKGQDTLGSMPGIVLGQRKRPLGAAGVSTAGGRLR